MDRAVADGFPMYFPPTGRSGHPVLFIDHFQKFLFLGSRHTFSPLMVVYGAYPETTRFG
jgi:hypothetical protein